MKPKSRSKKLESDEDFGSIKKCFYQVNETKLNKFFLCELPTKVNGQKAKK